MRDRVAPLATAILMVLVAGGVAGHETEGVPDEIVITAPPPESPPGPGTEVVLGEEARRRGARTVAEAIETLPGVVIQRHGSRTEPALVRLRGSATEHVLVMVDGVRVSDARSDVVDLNAIPIDSVERIEVYTGAATARYGNGAIAGAINIITGSATGDGPGVTTRVSAGSFGTIGAGGSVSFRVGKTDIETALSGLRSANSYTYSRAGAVVNRVNAEVLAGRFEAELRRPVGNGSGSLTVGAGGSDRGVPGTVEFPSSSATLRDGDVSVATAHRAGDASRGYLSYRSLAVRAGYRERSFSDPSYPLGALASDATLAWTDVEMRFGGWPASRLSGIGAVDVEVALGGRLEMLVESELGDRSRNVLAAAPRLASAGDEAWRWALSGRGELAGGDRSTGGTPEVLWSSRGELSWAPGNGPFRIEGAGGAGYRLPNFAELFLPISGFAVGNPDLRPERSTSAEAGLVYRLPGRARLRAAAYRTAYEDLIQWLPDPTGVWKPRNTGGAVTEGLEASLSATRDLGMSPWAIDLVADGNVGHAVDRGRGPTRGKQLPYRPRHSATASVTVRHLTGHALAGTARFVGPRPVTAQNTAWLDPYLAIDAALTWALPYRDADLTASVRNVLDEVYIDSRFLPNPGRELVLALEVAW